MESRNRVLLEQEAIAESRKRVLLEQEGIVESRNGVLLEQEGIAVQCGIPGWVIIASLEGLSYA